MKKWILIIFLLAIMPSDAYAEDRREETVSPITPYGMPCPMSGEYGYLKKELTNKDTVKTLIDYYSSKGLAVKINSQHGRFIEADIYKNGELVDKILLDRKTGRMRSIY